MRGARHHMVIFAIIHEQKRIGLKNYGDFGWSMICTCRN